MNCRPVTRMSSLRYRGVGEVLPCDGVPCCNPVAKEQKENNSGKDCPDNERPVGGFGEDLHALENDDGRHPVDDDAKNPDVNSVLCQFGTTNRISQRGRAEGKRYWIPYDVLDPLEPNCQEAPTNAKCIAYPGINSAFFISVGAAEFSGDQPSGNKVENNGERQIGDNIAPTSSFASIGKPRRLVTTAAAVINPIEIMLRLALRPLTLSMTLSSKGNIQLQRDQPSGLISGWQLLLREGVMHEGRAFSRCQRFGQWMFLQVRNRTADIFQQHVRHVAAEAVADQQGRITTRSAMLGSIVYAATCQPRMRNRSDRSKRV